MLKVTQIKLVYLYIYIIFHGNGMHENKQQQHQRQVAEFIPTEAHKLKSAHILFSSAGFLSQNNQRPTISPYIITKNWSSWRLFKKGYNFTFFSTFTNQRLQISEFIDFYFKLFDMGVSGAIFPCGLFLLLLIIGSPGSEEVVDTIPVAKAKDLLHSGHVYLDVR